MTWVDSSDWGRAVNVSRDWSMTLQSFQAFKNLKAYEFTIRSPFLRSVYTTDSFGLLVRYQEGRALSAKRHAIYLGEHGQEFKGPETMNLEAARWAKRQLEHFPYLSPDQLELAYFMGIEPEKFHQFASLQDLKAYFWSRLLVVHFEEHFGKAAGEHIKKLLESSESLHESFGAFEYLHRIASRFGEEELRSVKLADLLRLNSDAVDYPLSSNAEKLLADYPFLDAKKAALLAYWGASEGSLQNADRCMRLQAWAWVLAGCFKERFGDAAGEFVKNSVITYKAVFLNSHALLGLLFRQFSAGNFSLIEGDIRFLFQRSEKDIALLECVLNDVPSVSLQEAQEALRAGVDRFEDFLLFCSKYGDVTFKQWHVLTSNEQALKALEVWVKDGRLARVDSWQLLGEFSGEQIKLIGGLLNKSQTCVDLKQIKEIGITPYSVWQGVRGAYPDSQLGQEWLQGLDNMEAKQLMRYATFLAEVEAQGNLHLFKPRHLVRGVDSEKWNSVQKALSAGIPIDLASLQALRSFSKDILEACSKWTQDYGLQFGIDLVSYAKLHKSHKPVLAALWKCAQAGALVHLTQLQDPKTGFWNYNLRKKFPQKDITAYIQFHTQYDVKGLDLTWFTGMEFVTPEARPGFFAFLAAYANKEPIQGLTGQELLPKVEKKKLYQLWRLLGNGVSVDLQYLNALKRVRTRTLKACADARKALD